MSDVARLKAMMFVHYPVSSVIVAGNRHFALKSVCRFLATDHNLESSLYLVVSNGQSSLKAVCRLLLAVDNLLTEICKINK